MDFKAVSAGNEGLMIYRRLFELKVDQLEITRIDTSLNQVWKEKIEVAKNLELVKSQVKDKILFLLLKRRDYQVGDFLIAAIKVDNGEYVAYTVKNLVPFDPTEFTITNEAAFIGGYFNYRPLIVYFNFAYGRSKILPGFINEPGELTQIKPNTDGSTDVIISADNFEHTRCLWIRNYDHEGNLVKNTILQPDDKKNLIFGRSIKTEDDHQLVVGVYGRHKEYSRGIFIAEINKTGEYGIQYYNYAELQHFFNYLKAPHEKRIRERIERRRIKGKKLKFNYRFIVHEIVPFKDQFLMLGEAFYPQYAYPKGVAYGTYIPMMYSHSFSRGGYSLIGYHYTHAVVIGFNKKGGLLWDNSFEINDVMTPTLEQFVKIQALDEKVVLQYVFDDQIRTKIIKGSEMMEGKSFDELRLKFTDDVVKDKALETSRLDYWYEGHLFAYGVQKIKNLREIKVNEERKVFFVNKILYK